MAKLRQGDKTKPVVIEDSGASFRRVITEMKFKSATILTKCFQCKWSNRTDLPLLAHNQSDDFLTKRKFSRDVANCYRVS